MTKVKLSEHDQQNIAQDAVDLVKMVLGVYDDITTRDFELGKDKPAREAMKQFLIKYDYNIEE